jgi:hypothetical protein
VQISSVGHKLLYEIHPRLKDDKVFPMYHSVNGLTFLQVLGPSLKYGRKSWNPNEIILTGFKTSKLGLLPSIQKIQSIVTEK